VSVPDILADLRVNALAIPYYLEVRYSQWLYVLSADAQLKNFLKVDRFPLRRHKCSLSKHEPKRNQQHSPRCLCYYFCSNQCFRRIKMSYEVLQTGNNIPLSR
jgi:hypothetical protein